MYRYAVVIPAYNEARTIADIVSRARAVCSRVIVVDDGSTDGTIEKIADSDITLLRNETNMGKGASLWRGMQEAMRQGMDGVITLDADGQHAPEDIPRFLEAAEKNPDMIVIGSRMREKSAFPRKRYYANQVANFWLSWASGYEIEDSQSGFRLYPSSLLKSIQIKTNRNRSFVFESEILIEAATRGVRSIFIPIPAVYQENARASHFRSVMDIVRISMMVAWRLHSRFMFLPGLWRGVIKPGMRHRRLDTLGGHGAMSLVVSNIVIVATLGISYLWQLVRVFGIATTKKESPAVFSHIVILGARLDEDRVSQEFADRLDRAVVLHKTNPQAPIIVVGGYTGSNRSSEAFRGAAYLRKHGIPEAAITLESHSRHTLDNLKNISKLLANTDVTVDPGKVRIITSRYHVARVQAMARGLGLEYQFEGAESKLQPGLTNLLRLLLEAYYLHWYRIARIYQKMLSDSPLDSQT